MDKSTAQDMSSLAVTTPLGKDVLILQEFSGNEFLSGLFSFNLVMRSATDAVDLDLTQLVDKSLTVTLTGADGFKRYFNGVCVRVIQTATSYVAELRPWLWKLSLASNYAIYQDKTAIEIIKDVFSKSSFTDFKDSTSSTYKKREYCVQYGETNLNFVLRLMEDEGIFYSFSHASGKHTLILADDVSACVAISGTVTVPTLPLSPGKAWVSANHVGVCTLEQTVVSGKYQTDDYSFLTPTTDLKASVAAGSGTAQVYEYPGNHSVKDDGSSRAKLRLAALQAGARRLSGNGVVRAFTAGQTFTLEQHPRADLNASWVLHSVAHRATFREYTNSFTALPADTVFRPLRLTPMPRIAGSQTAIVVGKSGEEIWTDKYGRIKVQFHWDQLGKSDENSSCWLRVAQGWAGKSWGMLFVPRVGMEVLVSFLEGNPDLPIVTGCVYNGSNPLPYTLPTDQTKSTIKSNASKNGKGSNEICFEDKTDAEVLTVLAHKDLVVTVNNSRAVTIDKADDTLTLKEGNRADIITKGNDSLTISEGNRTITVSKGTETHSVKGTRSLTVEGAETRTNKAAVTWTVKGDFKLKVDGTITLEAGGGLKLKSGSSTEVNAGSGLTLKSGSATEISAGTGLTAKGGTTATVQGGTTLSLKGGAQATLDGGGMTTVKGGLIKLN